MAVRSPLPLLLLLLLTLVNYVQSEVSFNQVTPYASANFCVQMCVAKEFGSNYVNICGLANYASGYATCLCNTENGNSASMDYFLSVAPLMSSCAGGDGAATQAMAIFSAYCSVNRVGAVVNTASTTKASTARTASATAQASTGASPTIAGPQSTTVSSDTTTTTANSSNDSKGLSTSDKITIGCAIGGALVAALLAIPTWRHMRRGRNNNNNNEAQPLNAVPLVVNQVYHNPQQQPFIPQQYPPPYQQQQHGWGRNGWR